MPKKELKHTPVPLKDIIQSCECMACGSKMISVQFHSEAVEACNSHADLVEALELALKSMKQCDERQHIKRHSSDPIFKAEKALSKAKGA